MLFRSTISTDEIGEVGASFNVMAKRLQENIVEMVEQEKREQQLKYGQQKLDEINQKIIEDGLKPTSTVFLTQKEYLRNAIDECSATSNSFDEFQSKLLEQFQISVIFLSAGARRSIW